MSPDLDTLFLLTLTQWAGVSSLSDALIIFCASYLPWVMVGVVVVAAYLYIPKAEARYRLLATALCSASVALVLTESIRYWYHRPRPYLVYSLIQPLFTDSQWSFPSAHAAFFFAFSTAVYLYNRTWGAVCFAITLIMVTSRVIAGVHYPADIVGGGVLGVLVAYSVHNLFYQEALAPVKKATRRRVVRKVKAA